MKEVSNNVLPLSLMARVFAAVLFLLSGQKAFSSIVPSSRVVTWQGNVGVTGGVPAETQTIYKTLSPLGGSSDDTPQIQSALTSCPAGQVVKLAAGTFRLNSTLDWQNIGNGKVLRGSGPSSTTLNTYSSSTIYMRGSWYDPSNSNSTRTGLTASASKGDTSITVADASWINVGNCIALSCLDDTSFVSPNGEEGTVTSYLYPGTRGYSQLCKVTAKSGNTLTLDVPLYGDFTTGLSAQAAKVASTWRLSCGIEDLTIAPQFTDGNVNVIHMENCVDSWIRNVVVSNGNRCGVQMDFCYRCEVRHSTFNASHAYDGGQGYGVALYNITTACLVEDNIFAHLHLATSADFGTSGNVFAYNFEDTGYATSGQAPAGGTHGYHTMMNLWEGNYFTDKLLFDYTHGSGSNQTVLRNRILGYNSILPYDQYTAIHTEQWNRHLNIIGNILGVSGKQDAATSYYPSAWDGSDYKVILRFGDNGDSAATDDIILHGNYDTVNAGISWLASITDHAIPNSYYLSSKPAFFGSLSWPAFDPANAGSATATSIPAGYRWINGGETPGLGAIQAPSGAVTSISVK